MIQKSMEGVDSLFPRLESSLPLGMNGKNTKRAITNTLLVHPATP
jgi:hypothetical protein